MTHPLEQIADIVQRYGGEGMEIREKPFGGGAVLRVRLPSPEAVTVLGVACGAAGLSEIQVMDHIELNWRTASFDADGSVQVTIGIPAKMVRDYQEQMAALAALAIEAAPQAALDPAAPIELGPAPS